jgi:hypothetical protein
MTLAKRGCRLTPTPTAGAQELERRLFAAGEGLYQARLRLCHAREVVRGAEKALLEARLAFESAALEAAERAEVLEGLQAERARLSTPKRAIAWHR